MILKYREIPIMGFNFFFLLASVSFLGLTKLYGSRSKSKPVFSVGRGGSTLVRYSLLMLINKKYLMSLKTIHLRASLVALE